MGIFVFVYVLAVTARARTREIAVLRALGLRVRQLRRMLAWQGTVLAAGDGGDRDAGRDPSGCIGLGSRGRDSRRRPHAVVSPYFLLLVPLIVLVAIGASLVTSRRSMHAEITALLRAE